MTAFEVV